MTLVIINIYRFIVLNQNGVFDARVFILTSKAENAKAFCIACPSLNVNPNSRKVSHSSISIVFNINQSTDAFVISQYLNLDTNFENESKESLKINTIVVLNVSDNIKLKVTAENENASYKIADQKGELVMEWAGYNP